MDWTARAREISRTTPFLLDPTVLWDVVRDLRMRAQQQNLTLTDEDIDDLLNAGIMMRTAGITTSIMDGVYQVADVTLRLKALGRAIALLGR